MAMEKFDPNDPARMASMRDFFGPQMIDEQVRQAISFCWMALPPDRRNVDEVEKEIRRLVDRALRNLRDDATAFGLKSD